MKKIFSLGAVFALLCAFFLTFTSCKSDPNEQMMVGNWGTELHFDKQKNILYYDFFADKTFKQDLSTIEGFSWNEQGDTVVWLRYKINVDGRWKYRSNTLTLNYDFDTFKIYLIDASRVYPDGGHNIYTLADLEEAPDVKAFADTKLAELGSLFQQEFKNGFKFSNMEVNDFETVGLHYFSFAADTPMGRMLLEKQEPDIILKD